MMGLNFAKGEYDLPPSRGGIIRRVAVGGYVESDAKFCRQR
jgi:hypothetical protein